MTSAPVRLLRCPICVDTFAWTDSDLYEYRDGNYVRLRIPEGADPRRRQDLLRDAYQKCPHPSADMRVHYLPVAYGSYRDPLVIGLVGAVKAGKTHLLAAMIAEVERGGLLRYNLTAGPVDAGRHRDFLRDYVQPLVSTGAALRGTTEGRSNDFADALLISSATGTWPVAFFDVAGEDLMAGRSARFLAGTGGLIFVVDPDHAVGLASGSDEPAPTGTDRLGDRTFGAVLSRLRRADQRFLDIPAAITITKSDQLRFEPAVDWWIRRNGNGRIDAAQVAAESRAAYAFLYQRGALAWLQPFHDCRRCTLHFVSATGAEPRDGVYARGVRPRRVLEPLVALLAMTGILAGPDLGKVGT